MSALGNCQKCHREITLPALDAIEHAAHLLDSTDGPTARGCATAYLWMVARCVRGICLICQLVVFPLGTPPEARS